MKSIEFKGASIVTVVLNGVLRSGVSGFRGTGSPGWGHCAPHLCRRPSPQLRSAQSLTLQPAGRAGVHGVGPWWRVLVLKCDRPDRRQRGGRSMAHELSHELIRTEAMSRLSSCKQRRKATGFANAASCRLSSGLPQIKLYMYFYYWFSLDEFL